MKLEKIELLDIKIDTLFNAVYDLTTGQYELSKLEGLPKILSKFIKDEVWNRDGQFYFSMKKQMIFRALLEKWKTKIISII